MFPGQERERERTAKKKKMAKNESDCDQPGPVAFVRKFYCKCSKENGKNGAKEDGEYKEEVKQISLCSSIQFSDHSALQRMSCS